jgi:hypothetical protein
MNKHFNRVADRGHAIRRDRDDTTLMKPGDQVRPVGETLGGETLGGETLGGVFDHFQL